MTNGGIRRYITGKKSQEVRREEGKWKSEEEEVREGEREKGRRGREGEEERGGRHEGEGGEERESLTWRCLHCWRTPPSGAPGEQLWLTLIFRGGWNQMAVEE